MFMSIIYCILNSGTNLYPLTNCANIDIEAENNNYHVLSRLLTIIFNKTQIIYVTG